MGAVCSGGTKRQDLEHEEKSSSRFSRKLKSRKSFSKKQQQQEEEEDYHECSDADYAYNTSSPRYDSGPLPMEMKPIVPARPGTSKVAPVSSFFGRAGIVGLEKAVDVLDTLGSSMANLNPNSGFLYGITSKGNQISILAFEVANTIVKGANLMLSLSEEDIQFLKKNILHSEGVQQLVSTDMKELLSIAAADKREEFEVFSREVIRFGDLCKDPQWHNLGRFISKFDSDYTSHKQHRENAEMSMNKLTALAEHTSELYHEMHSLDRFQQDYNRKLEEMENLNIPRKGENTLLLQSELKLQKRVVRSLKKKSLWSRTLEEIVEKLVDIITFIHQEILEAFGQSGAASNARKEPTKIPHRLGETGLALHYASIITQIDNIASRPTSLPSSARDSLYNGLPASVKTALRSRLITADAMEGLTMGKIKAEMEKTLQWLVPVAANTTKAHQGFGWVGEWANTSNEFGKKTSVNNNLVRLQTLYHADQQKTDVYILELVIMLHRLISVSQHRNHSFNVMSFRSTSLKGPDLHHIQRLPSINYSPKIRSFQFSQEDRKLLEHVNWRRPVRGLSKSQEFGVAKKSKTSRLPRSVGNSPSRDNSPKNKICDIMDAEDLTFFLP